VAAAALQEPPVLGRGEAAVGDPDHPGQLPVPQIRADLAHHRGVGGVARPAPGPDRDAGAGDGHPDHHLRKILAGVLGVPVGAEPDLVTDTLGAVGDRPAIPVAGDRVVGGVTFEVGRAGVEEDQIDLEVQERGGGPEHL